MSLYSGWNDETTALVCPVTTEIASGVGAKSSALMGVGGGGFRRARTVHSRQSASSTPSKFKTKRTVPFVAVIYGCEHEEKNIRRRQQQCRLGYLGVDGISVLPGRINLHH